ncbi:hypothetical protein ABVT39_009041 [Epinephelus coioides]
MSEVSGVVDSSLTEARTQEAGVAGENGPFLCEEEKGQLHYVFDGEANVLEQLEAKDEPQQMIDVLCEEDAENWAHCACVRGLGPAIGLKNSFFLQPTSRHCEWQSESLDRCCFEVQTFPPCIPHSSTLPPAHVQLTFYCTVPSRKPPLTEYQARYTAEWAQPKMQQCYIHHHYPSFTSTSQAEGIATCEKSLLLRKRSSTVDCGHNAVVRLSLPLQREDDVPPVCFQIRFKKFDEVD